MAIKSRVTLVATFETGDKPQGSDYADWLDSFLHLTDTSAQAISSPVTFNASAHFQTIDGDRISVSSVNAALVSTGRLNVSAASGGAYHIDTLKVSASSVFNTLSANSIWVARLEVGSAAIVSGNITDLSAGTVNVNVLIVGSTVSAAQVFADRLEAVSAVIVSATLTDVSAGTINVDTLIVGASASFNDTFLLNGARIRVTAAIPTAGQHAQGDLAFNSGPAAGGTVGWVNVVAGAPGTWKEFGVIEA